MSETRTRRLFFALWPDEHIRAEIIRRRDKLDDVSARCVPDHNLHLTLLFLGDQPAEQVEAIVEAADRIDVPRFEMKLDRFGWFRQARVAWLGGPVEPKGQALVDALVSRMSALGLEFRPPKWVPHVTLFRRVSRCPAWPDVEPLRWPVQSFALVESVGGRPYQVLRTWPLE